MDGIVARVIVGARAQWRREDRWRGGKSAPHPETIAPCTAIKKIASPAIQSIVAAQPSVPGHIDNSFNQTFRLTYAPRNYRIFTPRASETKNANCKGSPLK
ncbi:hypothetical protein [Paracidovorax citrulli]